ncbi:MAG: hypothetical protein FJ288_05045 [Planctomycetes bacterium]|nr:hypothetical protein [Planctomycetota bacterium]
MRGPTGRTWAARAVRRPARLPGPPRRRLRRRPRRPLRRSPARRVSSGCSRAGRHAFALLRKHGLRPKSRSFVLASTPPPGTVVAGYNGW